VTRVGDDERGRRLVGDLEANGVEVCAIWAPEATGAIAVLVGADGQRTMATQRGASVGLSPEDLDGSWFRDAQLIHVPAYSLFVEPLASATRAAIRLVREGGGMLAVDLSSAAGLRTFGPTRMAYVLARLSPEVLFATTNEADTLAVPLESLAQVPVLKLGHAGCRVYGRTIPAPAATVIDSTGAGDAFAAAFCVAWLRGATPVESAERAVDVATQAVGLPGARPS
jgi:sugar/nucleoside kinase (ribokinase family)